MLNAQWFYDYFPSMQHIHMRICTLYIKRVHTYCIHLNTLRRNLLPQTHKPFTKNIWLPLNEPGIIGNVSLCTDY